MSPQTVSAGNVPPISRNGGKKNEASIKMLMNICGNPQFVSEYNKFSTILNDFVRF